MKDIINILLIMIAPKLAYFLKTPVLPPASTQFFDQIIRQSLKDRRTSHTKQNDFIDLMAEAIEDVEKKGKKFVSSKEELEDIIISNILLLLIAGQDTTSSTLSVAGHFLAKHQDLQEKLYQEIKDAVEENDNNPNLGEYIFSSCYVSV